MAVAHRRHALRIIHYNDVYNINKSYHEPVGGAARFVTAIRHAIKTSPVDTVVLFSGDAISPAPLTPLTEGAEIPPILNATCIDVACIGNHELDRGLNVMQQRLSETTFPWILSNVDDHHTGLPLANLPRTFRLTRGGLTLGILGLAGLDWVSTLATLSSDRVHATDYVAAANNLCATDGNLQDVDAVVALTHMRQPDDLRLARDAERVDLLLGGHDHIMWKRKVNDRWVVKSGSDFKNFSTLDVYVEEHVKNGSPGSKRVIFEEPEFHYITSDVTPDPYFDTFVDDQLALLGADYFDELALCITELDGRFVSVRTRETGLGNLVCDAMARQTGAPICLINAGSFRSDCVEPPGPMSRRTVDTVLPFQDEVITVSYTGTQLRAVLENSVSQYPLLDGRFLQVSGVRFRFDPLLPPQHRIIPGSVYVEEGKEYVPLCVDGEKRYVVATKTYVFAGKDGFPVGDSKYVVNRFDESLPTMFIAYLRLLAADSNVPRVPIGGGGGVTTTRHSDENSGIGNGIVNGNGVDVTLNGNGQHAANVNRNGHAIVSSNGDGSVHPQVVEDDDDDDSEDDNYNDDEDRRSKNRTAERKLMAVLNPMREGRIVCENECADLIKYYNAPSHDHH